MVSRVAIVLAGSDGLGRASVDALARSGHRVAFCARNGDRVKKVEAELRAAGHDALGLVADVAKANDLETLFSQVDDKLGRLDVLITNAGGPPAGAMGSVNDAQWQAAFELTLMSAVRSIRLRCRA